MRHILQEARTLICHSASTRSVVYFGGAIALLEATRRFVDPKAPDAIPRLHLYLLPPAMVWTALLASVDQLTPPTSTDIRRDIGQLLYGAGLGSASWLAVLSILRLKGWATLPAWGWIATSPREVAGAVPLMVLGQAAVACNEETLFRGYGFSTLQSAIGPIGATSILIPLFAVYHGTSPQVLLGTGVGGALFTLLRLKTGAVWMGLGYHWAWNAMQTAVFGPSHGLPSLRPVEMHGPRAWVGQPGTPELGGVAILVTLGVTILAALIGGHHTRPQA